MKTNKLDTIIRCLNGTLWDTGNSKSKKSVVSLTSITDTKLDWTFSENGDVMFTVIFQGSCDYSCAGTSFTMVREKALKELRQIKRNKEELWKPNTNS